MDAEKLKGFLEKHLLWVESKTSGKCANLRDADLSNADLRGANLRYADLIVLSLDNYTAYVQRDNTRIGCEYHANNDWLKWEPDDVENMASDASDWWEKHKPIIVKAIEIIRATPEKLKIDGKKLARI